MKEKAILSSVLRNALSACGESPYRVAEETGLDRRTLGRFLNGQHSMRLDIADRLAAYLGVEARVVKKGKDT